MRRTLAHMRYPLLALVLAGCGSSGSGDDDWKDDVPPPPETVNLMVESPPFLSVWHLQYRTNYGPWVPEDPEKGFFIDQSSMRSIADLKPGTYDFRYDLYAGPGTSWKPRELCCVEVYPDEHGDYRLVISPR